MILDRMELKRSNKIGLLYGGGQGSHYQKFEIEKRRGLALPMIKTKSHSDSFASMPENR